MSYLLSQAIINLAQLSSEDIETLNGVLEARLRRHLYGRAKVLPREVIDTVGEQVPGADGQSSEGGEHAPDVRLEAETGVSPSGLRPQTIDPSEPCDACSSCRVELSWDDCVPKPCNVCRPAERAEFDRRQAIEAEPPTERSPRYQPEDER